MTTLAQLSDLHLLEEDYQRRRGIDRARLSYLSAAVPYDPEGRYRNAVLALRRAHVAGAEHALLTGDLTEDGLPAQYDLLKEVLNESGFAPDQVTLVPGNHDTYSDPEAWHKALSGTLRAYRRTSGAHAVTLLDEAVIMPMSTVIESQTFMISVGAIKTADVERAAALAADPACKNRTAIVAMHHPPLGLSNPVVNAIDGLRYSKPMRDLLNDTSELRVLHGHIHRAIDRTLQRRSHAQVIAADAIRSGSDSLRLYKADAGQLHAVSLAPTTAGQPSAADWALPPSMASMRRPVSTAVA